MADTTVCVISRGSIRAGGRSAAQRSLLRRPLSMGCAGRRPCSSWSYLLGGAARPAIPGGRRSWEFPCPAGGRNRLRTTRHSASGWIETPSRQQGRRWSGRVSPGETSVDEHQRRASPAATLFVPYAPSSQRPPASSCPARPGRAKLPPSRRTAPIRALCRPSDKEVAIAWEVAHPGEIPGRARARCSCWWSSSPAADSTPPTPIAAWSRT